MYPQKIMTSYPPPPLTFLEIIISFFDLLNLWLWLPFVIGLFILGIILKRLFQKHKHYNKIKWLRIILPVAYFMILLGLLIYTNGPTKFL